MSGKHTFYVSICSLLIICVSYASADDRNLLPKYGSLPKEEWQKQSDDAFVAAVDKDYKGDRKKASNDLAMRGWQYLAAGNLDDAMRRFNQAWLLNDRNGVAIWGMAAIETSIEKFPESLKLFAEAEKLIGDDTNFFVDYARAISLAGVKAKDQTLLKEAFQRFEKIHQEHPQNTKNLQNWAVALFLLKRYPEAWAKVKLAEHTPTNGQLDPSFIAELDAKMPRPKD